MKKTRIAIWLNDAQLEHLDCFVGGFEGNTRTEVVKNMVLARIFRLEKEVDAEEKPRPAKGDEK